MTITGRSGRSILPGQTEELEIVLNTGGGRTQQIQRAVTVQTNDPNRPTVTLTCKAKQLVAFNCEPSMVNFGQIPRDSGPKTQTVILTRGDAGPLNPSVETPKGANVSAEIREIEPGEKYQLDVTVHPPWPNERISSQVTVHTGIEQAPTETIRIFAQLEPRLRAQPARFVLPRDSSTEAELKVRLVWSGEAGKAVSATVTDPSLSVRVDEEEDQQWVVLSVPAGYEVKPRTSPAVMVETDDPVAGSLRIPISPAVIAPARPATVAPAPVKGIESGVTTQVEPTPAATTQPQQPRY